MSKKEEKRDSIKEKIAEEHELISPEKIGPFMEQIFSEINPKNNGVRFLQQLEQIDSTRMNSKIASLPVFFIMEHSTEDIYFKRTKFNKEKGMEQVVVCLLVLLQLWVSRSRERRPSFKDTPYTRLYNKI